MGQTSCLPRSSCPWSAVQFQQRRWHDRDEPPAIVVPAVAVETAPGQLDDQSNPAFTTVERRNHASVRQRLPAIEVDAVRREVLADYDECTLDVGFAAGGVRREVNGIGIRIARFAPALDDSAERRPRPRAQPGSSRESTRGGTASARNVCGIIAGCISTMLIVITCRERRPIGLRISTDAAAQVPHGKDGKIMRAAAGGAHCCSHSWSSERPLTLLIPGDQARQAESRDRFEAAPNGAWLTEYLGRKTLCVKLANKRLTRAFQRSRIPFGQIFKITLLPSRRAWRIPRPT